MVLNTEFCGDINLQEFIDKRKNGININWIKEVFVSVARALAYLHSQNIFHRDIKLDNILINEVGIVKLIDFGFAVKNKSFDEPITNYCGTPSYMSPEIIKRKPYIGGKADIWALGVLLFKLICRNYPFNGNNDQELYASIINNELKFCCDVPKKVKILINKMLDKNPGTRITSGEVLSDDWVINN